MKKGMKIFNYRNGFVFTHFFLIGILLSSSAFGASILLTFKKSGNAYRMKLFDCRSEQEGKKEGQICGIGQPEWDGKEEKGGPQEELPKQEGDDEQGEKGLEQQEVLLDRDKILEDPEKVIKNLVRKGVDLNKGYGFSRETLLMYAAKKNNIKAISALLQAGADPERIDWLGKTALMRAADYGHFEAVQALIDQGADPGQKGAIRRTALMEAVNGRNIKVVEVLLKANVDVDAQDSEGGTALMYAASEFWGDNTEWLHILIQGGANPSIKDKNGENAFMYALQKNKRRRAEFLKEKSNLTKEEKQAADLIIATFDNNGDQIKELVKQGGNPNEEYGASRKSLLMYAAEKNNSEAIRSLIQSGANPNREDKWGETPLIRAAELGQVEAIQAFLDEGVSPNEKTKVGRTGLMTAAWFGKREAAEELIKAEAGLNSQDVRGETALIRAAQGLGEGVEVLSTLLEAGADPRIKDRNGEGAFMHALENNHIKRAELLKERSDLSKAEEQEANMIIATFDNDGERIRELVRQNANPKKEYGGERKNLLFYAVEKNKPEAIEALIQVGLDPNQRSWGGRTLLMQAAEKGNLDAMKALIQGGAKPDVRDKNGEDAFIYAVIADQREVIQFLKEEMQLGEQELLEAKLIKASRKDEGGKITALAKGAEDGK